MTCWVWDLSAIWTGSRPVGLLLSDREVVFELKPSEWITEEDLQNGRTQEYFQGKKKEPLVEETEKE